MTGISPENFEDRLRIIPAYGTLKKYGASGYRLSVYRPRAPMRTFGGELGEPLKQKDEQDEKIEPLCRLQNNITRARSVVRELGLCNDWEYFATFTLDKAKYDRDNLPRWQRDFAQWIRDQRKRGGDYRYLLIPEQHKDGAWHMHGLLGGIPEDELSSFVAGIHPEKLVRGKYLNWNRCFAKFGYCSLGRLRDAQRAVTYVTKYVTKALGAGALAAGCHAFYASQGLERAEVVARGKLLLPADFVPEYSDEWVALSWAKDAKYLDYFVTNEVG